MHYCLADACINSEHAKNACSISLPLLRQNYLVTMGTSIDKLENMVKIHHRKALSYGKKVAKIGPSFSDILRDVAMTTNFVAKLWQNYLPLHLSLPNCAH